jgi:hypothetical protein
MAIPIPDDVRELLQAPRYVHLSTLRADGSPCTWVVCAGLEDDHILAVGVWLDGQCAGNGKLAQSPAGLEDDHILVCNPVPGCPVR